MLQFNPVMAEKYRRLTAEADAAAGQMAGKDGAAPGQVTSAAAAARARRAKARVACAASLLRWIYFLVVHDAAWDPAAASGGAADSPAEAA
jgi:hypothetical protein